MASSKKVDTPTPLATPVSKENAEVTKTRHGNTIRKGWLPIPEEEPPRQKFTATMMRKPPKES